MPPALKKYLAALAELNVIVNVADDDPHHSEV
jgi:2-phospho-L-lactate transferase/gluconeogenesis factor (CofD/UPF0052 family)